MEPGIRVTVTPSQSSYFAGERFSATITFKNTRASRVEPGTLATIRTPSTIRTHKRGAHSISSAPLAKPPTSPGPSTPRTPTPSNYGRSYREMGEGSSRKGLIGIDAQQENGAGSSGWRGRHTNKALSVSISPQAMLGEAAVIKSASYATRSFLEDQQQSPHSPRTPSTLARLSSLPLSPDHPHARKKSVLDGSPLTQFEIQQAISPVAQPPYTTAG